MNAVQETEETPGVAESFQPPLNDVWVRTAAGATSNCPQGPQGPPSPADIWRRFVAPAKEI